MNVNGALPTTNNYTISKEQKGAFIGAALAIIAFLAAFLLLGLLPLASNNWFHVNLQGLMIGTAVLGICLAVLFYYKLHQISHETRAKKMRYGALIAIVLLTILTITALAAHTNAFNSSNHFMSEGMKQWQGWIGPAGILAISALSLTIIKYKNSAQFVNNAKVVVNSDSNPPKQDPPKSTVPKQDPHKKITVIVPPGTPDSRRYVVNVTGVASDSQTTPGAPLGDGISTLPSQNHDKADPTDDERIYGDDFADVDLN